MHNLLTMMNSSCFLFSLLLVLDHSHHQPVAAFQASVLSSLSQRTLNNGVFSSTDDAQEFLDRASRIRAEIAALEGKTVAQVEQEAKDKKELQQQQVMKSATTSDKEHDTNTPSNAQGRMLQVPNNRDDMVWQAARAVERAFQQGNITRQTVRFVLLDSEDQSIRDGGENAWPGGAQQMSRVAGKPTTKALLERLRVGESGATMEKVMEQDIWDFDGSALMTAHAREGAAGDIQSLVFPNTDVKYLRDIQEIDQVMGKDRLFLLVNPFWRNVESWGFNILAPGAKKKAQEVIFDRGYEETYACMRFSARGEECVAIKAYPYDWQIFAYVEDEYSGWETAIRLGECAEEPKSAFVTELLNNRPEFKESKMMRQMGKR